VDQCERLVFILENVQKLACSPYLSWCPAGIIIAPFMSFFWHVTELDVWFVLNFMDADKLSIRAYPEDNSYHIPMNQKVMRCVRFCCMAGAKSSLQWKPGQGQYTG